MRRENWRAAEKTNFTFLSFPSKTVVLSMHIYTELFVYENPEGETPVYMHYQPRLTREFPKH